MELCKVICIEQEHADNIIEEWNMFKFEDFTHSMEVYMKSPWMFYANYSMSYPLFCQFAQHFFLLPINTAACERGFSKMKLIKTNIRNRLDTKQLDNLMLVSLSSSYVDRQEIIGLAISMWEEMKNRYFSKRT